jgi:hypothetical protein
MVWFLGIFALVAIALFAERRLPVINERPVTQESFHPSYTDHMKTRPVCRTRVRSVETVRRTAPFQPPTRRLRDTLGTPAPFVGLNAFLDQADDDRAGTQNVFEPGPGFGGVHTSDWNWTASLEISQPKTVKSMLMVHHVPGEGWSTSAEYFGGKLLYPLVVFYQGRQMNRAYDNALGTYGPGVHTFQLYGQQETAPFAGAHLYVAFTDGTYAVARVESETEGWTDPSCAVDFLKMPVGHPEMVNGLGERPSCPGPIPFDLGQVWHEREGVWDSVWTRKGAMNVFDAVSRDPQSHEVRYEVVFTSVSDGTVKLFRKDTQGYYYGTLSCDGKRVLDGVGDWFVAGDRWSAEIEGADQYQEESR